MDRKEPDDFACNTAVAVLADCFGGGNFARRELLSGGLGFKASKIAFLWGGGIALIALVVSVWMLDERIVAYRKELIRLYNTIHYDVEPQNAYIRPLEVPDTYDTLVYAYYSPGARDRVTELFNRLLTFAVAVFGLVILPLLAETAVVVKLYLLAEARQFLVWTPSILLVAVLVSAYYAMLWKGR